MGGSPELQYEELQKLTDLVAPGATPFHLRLEVQLYGLTGEPEGTGQVEEWWLEPHQFRIEYAAGDWHSVIASGPAAGSPSLEVSRTEFLMTGLVDQVQSPLPPLRSDEEQTVTTRTVANIAMNCLTGHAKKPHSATDALERVYGTVCASQQGGYLSFQYGQNEPFIVTRNKFGLFHDKQVPLQITLASPDGHIAVEAKITGLQTINPANYAGPSLVKDTAEAMKESARTVGGGGLLKRVSPEYPLSARSERVSGTVWLRGDIGTDGKVKSLTALASPDKALTKAALEAVQRWVFEPFTLNGRPTELVTTIPIDFEFGGS